MNWLSTCRIRRSNGSQLIEFAPVLFTAVSFCLLVSLNLVALAAAYGSVYLIARESCAHAAKAASFDAALGAMSSDCSALGKGPLGKLLRLTPSGGFGGNGVDLYIAATNIYSSKTSVTGPNQILPAIDTTDNVYECCTQVKFEVAPLMNFASVPLLGGIPGFGVPLTLTCAAHKAIEQPNAFATASSTQPEMSVPAASNQTQIYGTNYLCSWNMWVGPSPLLLPGIQVAQQTVGTVYADNPNWVSLPDANGNPITLKSGQRMSLLLKQGDLWSYQVGALTNALGDLQAGYVNGMPEAALTFKVGANGTAYRPTGFTQMLTLPYEGVVYFRCNAKNYTDASLEQTFQVMITN